MKKVIIGTVVDTSFTPHNLRVFRNHEKRLVVEIWDDTQHASIYYQATKDSEALIVGTMSRRRVLDRSGPNWTAATIDGQVVARAEWVSQCLTRFAKALPPKLEIVNWRKALLNG